MNRSILGALILMPALLLSCSPQIVATLPAQETPVASETPVSMPTALTSPSPPTLPSPSISPGPATSPIPTQTRPLPPRDTFMKGFNFADWNSSGGPRPTVVGPLYDPPHADWTLKNLAATGANWT